MVAKIFAKFPSLTDIWRYAVPGYEEGHGDGDDEGPRGDVGTCHEPPARMGEAGQGEGDCGTPASL